VLNITKNLSAFFHYIFIACPRTYNFKEIAELCQPYATKQYYDMLKILIILFGFMLMTVRHVIVVMF